MEVGWGGVGFVVVEVLLLLLLVAVVGGSILRMKAKSVGVRVSDGEGMSEGKEVRVRTCLNAVVLWNMPDMSVTLDTSHLERSDVKDVA